MKTTEEFLRKLALAAAVVGVAAPAYASGDGVDVFTIQGFINFSATTGPDLTSTFGIVTGDSFTGTITYDSSQPAFYIFGQNDPTLVAYQVPEPLITLTVQGQQFSLYAPDLFVYNPDVGPSWEITTYAGIHADPDITVQSPWGAYTGSPSGINSGVFTLENSPGFSLSDPSLPTQLDIADWSGEHQIVFHRDFGGSGGVDNGNFYLDAEITSITVAPEPGTMALLGLGAVGLALIRRRERK